MNGGEEMQRIIELRVKIPEIVLTYWFPGEQDALSFPLDQVKGTITLNLDPESVKVLDYEVDDSYGCDSILVRIEGQMSEGRTEREFLDVVCKLAVEYVNRLLSFFRNEMGQYWINLLHIHEHGLSWFLGESDAKWVDESGTTRATIGGITVPPDMEQADLFRYRYRRWRESEIDEREWQKIRDFIERGESSDLAKSMIVNAEQHLADGDLQMAIVEVQTAFEVFVHRLVKECYQKNDKTQPNLEECGFKNVLCDHLSRRVRRFERGVTQYDEWEAKAYRPRCDIVHRGRSVSH
jgi:hypothetical protein